MALSQQVQNKLENGDGTPATGRQALQALGFTPYIVNGKTCGWTDPLTGRVLLVGKHNADLDHALSFLPPGWVWSTTATAQNKWTAKVAPDQAALASVTATKACASEAIALFVAIATARAAL